ncbi:VOC family protein [Mesorhizobium sp. M4B.F.Ca.ET.215.01.1.1]|uniref:VOC family protein n=1 Tax=unclassified Mesorhizobium TaxID=325217 RepID=UPI000FD57929|nr:MULTISPECIES: VOC family protein [unclassified Mesorhizobium]RUW22677.1 VOC family protein [Mesorhizobium sp. M4B.F.Ca.ET.013.02.1.1]RWF65364.1 MAG: VOC family protein [Mesorhizobium sp.]TGQ08102.1 VOC family protein [Mesorhizobium sp. M4B.F.Ca.ET.215.01.1.1]TGQ35893.1 VOC family protein [Mesorhizobium sp. M00.F.Ca.ET.220.01.1.1]TGR01490.1 VOC family protein [Mesorhizobium sp. M4B.F.Ca.ET.203.01.1.1]
MSELPFAATTPVSVSRVGLKARDAEGLAAYYRAVVGLQELSRADGVITLGAANRPLLVLEPDAAAKPDDPRSAGLFHTAFLLPSRADLGRWINHAAANRIAIEGASDHLVSEALYMTDPEGNGIEIYADRSPQDWKWDGDKIAMATERLNLPAVVASVPAGDAGWQGAPENTIVGHVHLRVGRPEDAEAYWHDEFGFDTVAKYGGQAVFLSSGGYHHHIGANAWRSAGSGRRDPARSGLAWVEMRSDNVAGETSREDPWGTVIRTIPGKA